MVTEPRLDDLTTVITGSDVLFEVSVCVAVVTEQEVKALAPMVPVVVSFVSEILGVMVTPLGVVIFQSS